MLQDFRFALRLFRRQPAPVAIAVGGLALAIGAVSSVFTLVDATMLKPYGMDDPASVISVGSTRLHGWSEWSYSTYLRMHEEATLARVEASLRRDVRFSLSAHSDTDVSREARFVSGGYLQMLGGRPALGRSLEPFDDLPGAQPVAVVSHSFWTTSLSADPAILGKPLWLNGSAVTVVGVLQTGFTGPVDPRPSIWMPLGAFDEVTAAAPFDARSTVSVEVIARLAHGATIPAAQDNLAAVVNRLAAARVPSTETPRAPVQLFSAASPLSGRDATESYLAVACILGIVGLVLAVACANTSNLLLAAAVTRRHEFGVRLSLGANTRQLARQLVNESVLVAGLAGGLGFLFSVWSTPLLQSALSLSPEFSVEPDARVLAFTIGVAIVCGLGAGILPARHGCRSSVIATLKSARTVNPATARTRLTTSFVGFQAAVSIFLLVAAALFARTAFMVMRTSIGFDHERLLTVSLDPNRLSSAGRQVRLLSKENSPAEFNESVFVTAASAALRDLPSVEAVSVVEHLPWGWSLHRLRFTEGGTSYVLNVSRSDAEFFRTTGVRIVRGRAFTADEVAAEAPVAVISASVAREFFGEADPIGRPLSAVPTATLELEPATIIGIASDAMLTSSDAEVYGSVYRPMRRLSVGGTEAINPVGFVVRTASPARAMRAVEDALQNIDSSVRSSLTVVSERVDSYLGSRRMMVWLSAPLAALSLLLATLGVFGVSAFSVGQRMHEISVRLALGASAMDVRTLLLRDNLLPVVIGLSVGLAAALITARLTARMFNLSGISPHDPVAIAAATVALLAGALFAVVGPARRATRADPASLLRST